MFSISFYELLVILIIIFMLLKPKEIGSYLYNVGKIIKKTKNFIFNVQNQIEDIATLGNINDYEIKDKKNISNKEVNKPLTNPNDYNSKNNNTTNL